MSFVPDMAVLLAYSLACLVLFITPGPDMSLFVAKTLTGGRRAGIAAMAGAMIGCVVHSLLAAFGLSALIAASPAAFLALKIVGALYLFWLAVDAVRNGSALSVYGGRTRTRAVLAHARFGSQHQSHQSQSSPVLRDVPAAVHRSAGPACVRQVDVSRDLLRRSHQSAGGAPDPRCRAAARCDPRAIRACCA